MLKSSLCNIILAATLLLLAACGGSSDEYDSDAKNAYVKTPAWPILNKERNLAQFHFTEFTYTDTQAPANDSFTVYFGNFQPNSNIEPDDDAIDQSGNDLSYGEDSWEDSPQINWLSNNNILSSSSSSYQKNRSYRILNAGSLEAAIATKNRPFYEAIEQDVFTQHLATTYIWDMANFDTAKATDLSDKKIADYETNDNGLSILPHAVIWSDVDRTNRRFSLGAELFVLSESVNADVYVVEAVDDNNSFSLAAAVFDSGLTSLNDVIAKYQESLNTRLAYKFSVGFMSNRTIYISFDSGTQMASLSTSASAAPTATVSYNVYASDLYAEINTNELSLTDRDSLGLTAAFKPIITGPVNENASINYYAGKHYIKTTKETRNNLQPIFLFNTKAQNDIKNSFKAWRDKKYEDFK